MPDRPSTTGTDAASDAEVMHLVQGYAKEVSLSYSRFAEAAQLVHPFEWRHKALPRVGQVKEFEYEFHGAGLRLRRGDQEIDFNFGPRGEVGGVDPWFLAQFAQRKGERDFADHMRLRELLADLVRRGLLAKQASLFWEPDYAPKTESSGRPPLHVGLEIASPTFWVPRLGHKLGAVDPAAFGISPALVGALEAWESHYGGQVDGQGCISDKVARTLHEEGLVLWERVAKELGDRFEVHYDSPLEGQSFRVR